MESGKGQNQILEGVVFLLLSVAQSGAAGGIWVSSPDCGGICVSDPPGAPPTPLLSASEELHIGAFDLSPDGQSIAFMNILTGNEYHDVWIMDADGSNPRALASQRRESCYTSTSGRKRCSMRVPSFSHSIQWSPDGAKILYDSFDDRWVLINPEGRRCCPNKYPGYIYPFYSLMQWHENGSLVFSSGKQYAHIIMIIDPSTETLIHRFDLFSLDPALSPDGSKLSFYRVEYEDRSPQYDFFVMDMGGGAISHIGNGSRHAWSPDGRRIVYSEYQGKDLPWILRVVNADGTDGVDLFELSSLWDIEWISGQVPTGVYPASWGTIKKEIAGE